MEKEDKFALNITLLKRDVMQSRVCTVQANTQAHGRFFHPYTDIHWEKQFDKHTCFDVHTTDTRNEMVTSAAAP